MNQQQENVQYETYSEYEKYDGVDVMWPIEISENIAGEVIDFVKRNVKVSEINSVVEIIQLNFSFANC